MEACIREAWEEAGVKVRVTGLLRLMVDSHGTLRADAAAEPKSVPDWESVGAMWVDVKELAKLKDWSSADVADGRLQPHPVNTEAFRRLEELIRRLTTGDDAAQEAMDATWRNVQKTYPSSLFQRERLPRGGREARGRMPKRSGAPDQGGAGLRWASLAKDHFETSADALHDVAPLLRRAAKQRHLAVDDLRVYDPYYCNGRAKELLKALGFRRAINRRRDFYADIAHNTVPQFHVLLTNPPYSGDHKACARLRAITG
eukprot:g2057.t1